MKAELVIECDVVNPDYDPVIHQAALDVGVPYEVSTTVLAPAGTVIDHPDAYQLCRLGVAIPLDEECTARAGMTPEQLKRAQAVQAMYAKGMGHDPELIKKLKRRQQEAPPA